MFRGTSHINLDEKGRFRIPVKFRPILTVNSCERLLATKDPYDKCLLLYPMSEWEEIEKKLSLLPNLDPENRCVQRVLIGSAEEVALDKAGRLLLPAHLRAYAGIEKNATCVGQIKKIEVWASEVWAEQEERTPERGVLKESLGSLCL